MKNRKTLFYVLCFIIGWLMTVTAHGNIFDPDVEVKVYGLVCPSCAIGIKNGLKKTKLIKDIKFDTKKQICLIEYISIEVHPSQLIKIVKNAGYGVKSIRWLKDKKPNRYNKP
tara:strand:- start:100 stop:438 length:339 start_codon:yes stop_codon:yes gene_type:complete